MINGIEGIPGSGKSYEAVTYHILPALKDGRKVITNLPLELDYIASLDSAYKDLIEIRTKPQPVRGIWDAKDIAARPAFQLFDDGHVDEPDDLVETFGHVWDFYDTWRNDKGQGPLFVIDECHVPFPEPRQGRTPREIIQWFKLSRHFGADVLLMTQDFRDVEPSIARLMAILVKVRKADIIGKSGYIRKTHGGYRGAMISKETREYKPEYFRFYRSHTQGSAVVEATARDTRSIMTVFNRSKWVTLALGLIAVVWAFWPDPKYNMWGASKDMTTPLDRKTLPAAAPMPTPVHAQGGQAVRPAPAAAVVPQEPPEPPRLGGVYADYGIHINGVMRMGDRAMVSFVVSAKDRTVFAITDADLRQAGYRWQQQGYCAGWLIYGDTRRAVTCDAPHLGQGTENKPIVFDSSTGARSDGRRFPSEGAT